MRRGSSSSSVVVVLLSGLVWLGCSAGGWDEVPSREIIVAGAAADFVVL